MFNALLGISTFPICCLIQIDYAFLHTDSMVVLFIYFCLCLSLSLCHCLDNSMSFYLSSPSHSPTISFNYSPSESLSPPWNSTFPHTPIWSNAFQHPINVWQYPQLFCILCESHHSLNVLKCNYFHHPNHWFLTSKPISLLIL